MTLKHPPRSPAWTAVVLSVLLPLSAPASPPDPQVLIYSTEGNRLRRYDADTVGGTLVEDVLQPSASDAPGTGRDSNGMICRFRDGSGRYLHGEDTDQPNPPAGFGLFAPDGTQVGKLTPTYPVYSSGQPEPFGCTIRDDGILFTSDVGQQGFGFDNGQLTMWFPPYDHFPGPAPPDPNAYPNNSDVSPNFCKIDETVGTAAAVVIDGQQRVYLAASSGLAVYRYDGAWPTGLGPGEGCEASDSVGGPMVDPGRITRTTFLPPNGLSTYSGLALAPDGNSLYAATNLEGRIREFDLAGNLLRFIVDHAVGPALLPKPFGTPQGISVGPDGTIYYADLDLAGVLPNVGPGPNGKVWRVRFDGNGDPLTPEIVRQGLGFPDGVAALTGDLEPPRRRSFAGGPHRLAYYGEESKITAANAANLAVRWRYTAGGAITGSPVVATVDLPGEGAIRVVYFLSWDRHVHAVRFDDGSELWKAATAEQPNATFPTVASVDVARIDGVDIVYIGSGEVFYALDAVTGAEIWRFTAGTGCGTLGVGDPFPGFCSPGTGNERNEIEGSAFVANGVVFVTMDVNDVDVGKGGLYGLDARDGRMRWFFDLESGLTCRPLPGEDIRQYDGYHSEAELNLPPGFLSRPGCDGPRTPNGCGNVWSSPAIDFEREAFYIASSNCDTDFDNATNRPEPPMPPYDEALMAIRFDGDPVWKWRLREVDNDDLAYGGAPNLFEIDFGGALRQVVGVGNKDGSYTVLDRDGINQLTGLLEPYWRTQVVPGGDLGGVPATASADVDARRIFFSTAPGDGTINDPSQGLPAQQPTLHALDMDTGAIVWQNDPANGFPSPQDASFGPAAASPGVVYFAQVPGAALRVHDGATGAELAHIDLANAANASMATVVDGTVLVGEGIGPGFTATLPSDLTALCALGTAGCEDADADLVPDSGDNCPTRSNPEQEDTNFPADDDPTLAGVQHYGNACDADFDDDGFIGAFDFIAIRRAFGSQLGDAHYDPAIDCNGDDRIASGDFVVCFVQRFGLSAAAGAVLP